MNPERLRRIEELYHAAREREPGEREVFLSDVCGDDVELLRKVASLLAQDSSAETFEQPVFSVAAALLNEDRVGPGTRVGPYHILDLLGEGGMGEVYRAKDTRLGRMVAVKIAFQEFSGRFQREARAISALNHPHICTLHDIGPNYLVMELVEGETLAQGLEKGSLPRDAVLRYGSQIADALATAHAKGITHRDLKPSNLMVTKAGIKVLDFGLAKFDPGHDLAAPGPETATASQTFAGTPAYAAPEQLEGKPCDARTDIFALGLVLYEMATGNKAFSGDSRAALIGEIMRCEPALEKLAPPQFAHLVERCLAKDPEDRWQTARDVKLQLDFLYRITPTASPPSAEKKRRWWPIAVSVFAAASLMALALSWVADRSRSGKADLTAVPLISYPGIAMNPSLSPDGTRVAFIMKRDTDTNFDLYWKQIGPGSERQLTTSSADEIACRWSPDGTRIAFLRLQADAGTGPTAGVYVVPAPGGLEQKLADADLHLNVSNRLLSGDVDCLDWSPDGKWLVISRRPSPGQPPGLALLSLESEEVRQLTSPPASHIDMFAAFAPDGHALAFRRAAGVGAATLMLLPLSDSLWPRGPAIEIPVDLGTPVRAFDWTADSRELVASAGFPESAALWRFRASAAPSPRLIPFPGGEPVISRRGDRMVFSRHTFEWNIWSLDLDETGRPSGPAVKAFDSSKNELTPAFSPDGTRVALGSNRSGFYEIWVCRSNGSDCDQLTAMKTYAGSPAWSPDGKSIAFDSVTKVHVVNSAGGKPRELAPGLNPRWSGDGKWIYYGNRGVYRTSPSGGHVEQVTRSGGGNPAESPDEKWLYHTNAGVLKRMLLPGGESTEVLPAVNDRNYVVREHGIWYLTPNTAEGSRLEYYDFATRSTRIVYRTSRPVFAGMTMSPDGRRLLFTQVDKSPTRELMLVENFR